MFAKYKLQFYSTLLYTVYTLERNLISKYNVAELFL